MPLAPVVRQPPAALLCIPICWGLHPACLLPGTDSPTLAPFHSTVLRQVGQKLVAANLGWRSAFALLNAAYYVLHYCFAAQEMVWGSLMLLFVLCT